jgi:hypothetical protein
MIRVVHPGIPDPWVKKAPDPGSMGQKGTGSRPWVKKAPDPGSMSQKGTGYRIRKTGDYACSLPEDGEGIDGLLMGVAGVILAVH